MKHSTLIKLLFVFMLSACSSQKSIQEQIEQTIISEKNNTCKLSKIVSFKWDKLYVCGPYFTNGALDSSILPYKDDILSSGVKTDDRICYLLFFNENKLIAGAVVKRNIDFADLYKLDKNGHILPLNPSQKISWTKISDSMYKIILHN